MPTLEDHPLLVIDGATGTEIDRCGHDVSLPLWSARALIDTPEVVEKIHTEYLEAGARAVVTNTFRTHRRSLAKEGMGDRAQELTARAVKLACAARDRVDPGALVLGSVSPLEDCYHAELAPSEAEALSEHEEMIRNLLDAGADAILLETMGTIRETLAAAESARRLAPGRWMVSFCTEPGGPPGMLLHGRSFVDALEAVSDAAAVGINCVSAPEVEGNVRLLGALLPDDVRIAAYANVGHQDDGGTWHQSDAVDPERYAEYARAWVDAGATIVGGCCGTTPETIRAVVKAIGAGR